MIEYATWRITFQSSEAAARAAYEQWARLEAENTALRLYAPAQRAGSMPAPVQIAPTNWEFWGIVETDDEFAARAGRRITEDVG
jgi:hypothetical protein